MFEIKTAEPMISKTFRFPDTLIKKIERLARLNKVSANQVVIQACEYALSEMEESKK
jgi:hypothetical protein